MLNIEKKLTESKLEVALIGRLDTTTAPELEKELRESLSGITELVLDFADLEYISSAGLRVVLGAQKTMNSQGTMVVKNLTEEVRDVFDITGFTDILTIE